MNHYGPSNCKREFVLGLKEKIKEFSEENLKEKIEVLRARVYLLNRSLIVAMRRTREKPSYWSQKVGVSFLSFSF